MSREYLSEDKLCGETLDTLNLAKKIMYCVIPEEVFSGCAMFEPEEYTASEILTTKTIDFFIDQTGYILRLLLMTDKNKNTDVLMVFPGRNFGNIKVPDHKIKYVEFVESLPPLAACHFLANMVLFTTMPEHHNPFKYSGYVYYELNFFGVQ